MGTVRRAFGNAPPGSRMVATIRRSTDMVTDVGFGPQSSRPERERAVRILQVGPKTSEGYTAMLVLSRKKNESIVINNDIIITVVEIRGDKVRLGIVAPKDVPVHRQEVYEAIHGHRPDAAPTAVVTNPDPSGRA